MSILKLQNEGDTHTATARSVAAVQGQYGEQVEFIFENGDKLYLPKDSADRQLTRLGLDYESAVGAPLTFSRDHNPKKGAKPYWGIAFATAQEVAPPSRPQRVQPPTTVAPPRQAALDKHIPGLDDPPDWSDVPNEDTPYAEPNVADPRVVSYATGPAPTPREQTDPAVRRRNVEQAYLALYGRVAQAVVKHHVDAHAVVNVPDLAAAVQSAAATIWISWDKRGLQP